MDIERIKLFKDRNQAEIKLANILGKYKSSENIMILVLPRGGVPGPFEITKSPGVTLEVFITRKLRFPNNPELAVGALAENGEIFLNKEFVDYYPDKYLEEISHQKEETKQR